MQLRIAPSEIGKLTLIQLDSILNGQESGKYVPPAYSDAELYGFLG